ncbi:MAG: hypothetical protein R6X35_09040 [Candidatus Krumholzibacteriia bacterium]
MRVPKFRIAIFLVVLALAATFVVRAYRMRAEADAAAAAAASAGAVATAASSGPTAPRPPAGTWVYDCGRDVTFTVLADGPDRVRVILPDRELVLARADSSADPSSALYTGDGSTFWIQGGQSRLETPGAVYAGCRSNVELAIWADALQRGVDFRAWGRNPLWQAEISEGRMIAIQMGHGRREEFPAPEATSGDDGVTTYRSLLEGRGLMLTVRPEVGQDPATGQATAAVVEAVLDGRTYRGYGRAVR